MYSTKKALLITLISTVLMAPSVYARQGADDGVGHIRQEDRQLDRRQDRQLDRRADRGLSHKDKGLSGKHKKKQKGKKVKQKKNRR